MAINRENFVAGIIEDYDERLLERRLTTEGNVCGCLLKNLDLYEDCGLDVLDFVTNNGRLLFLMAKKLREKGIQKFDEVTFVSSLEPEFVKMVENTLGDYNQVYNVMESVSDKNWESFLDELNKSNVQMRLYRKGFSLFQKVELDNGKSVVPFEFFKNLSSNEVLEFYEGVITSMQTKVQNFKLVEEGYIDFDDNWLDSLKRGEEMGVSYGEAGEDIDGNEIRTFPFMSNNTLGLKPGTLSAWGAHSGVGKALPNESLIPTPSGFKKVGDIKAGDYLFGQNGKPTKVLMIHPQNEQKEIWKVHFSDGRVVECCKDHLWEYRYRTHRGYNYRVETTEQIYDRAANRYKRPCQGYIFDIKLNGAVEYPKKNLSVDPYVLGTLLGNGCFSGKALQFSSGTNEVPNLISAILGNVECIKTVGSDYTYDFRYKKDLSHRIKTADFLKEYPELVGTYSHNKFIPKEYLYSSIEQRMSLLQGLLDTDGSIESKNGKVRFSTTSPSLKDDVIELCRSLGFIAIAKQENRTRYKSGVCYNISISTPKEFKAKLFRTQQKRTRANEYVQTNKRTATNDHIAIVNIEKTAEKTDMTCFTVEADDHLFLTNDYIVTHNTTYMVTTAMSLAAKGEKIVMVTNESRLGELKAIFLAWVICRVFNHYKISKRKIISGQFAPEDYEYLKKAQDYWREHYAKKIKIEVLSDADTAFSCQLIKRAILREGASVFIVDTMKMTISDGPQDNTWIGLIKDVRTLTEIAMRYNVIGLLTVQLAMSSINRCWLDGSCLANCKQIKETLSNLILFRKLYGPELDPNSPYFIQPFRKKQNENGEWYDEPYDADPTKQWIIAFSDKTRRGTDSGMDGTAFLCRTDLDHASFYETARCRPTRKLMGEERRA